MKSSDLVWVAVSDIEQARRFFADVLGLHERSYGSEYKWCEFTCPEGGATLGVGQANEQVAAGQNGIITFTVDDVAQKRKDLEARGVTMIGEIMEVPGHVKLQMFQDPDGNLFQLVEQLS